MLVFNLKFPLVSRSIGRLGWCASVAQQYNEVDLHSKTKQTHNWIAVVVGRDRVVLDSP